MPATGFFSVHLFVHIRVWTTLGGPVPVSNTFTSSDVFIHREDHSRTIKDSSSLLPCSMALIQASATAVLRSSTRSGAKPISFATLEAVLIAIFSKPRREGRRSSILFTLFTCPPTPPTSLSANYKCSHIIGLRFLVRKCVQCLPDRVQGTWCIDRTGGAERLQKAVLTEFFVALKDLSHSVGVD